MTQPNRFSPGCCCEGGSPACCPEGGNPFDPPVVPPPTLYATIRVTTGSGHHTPNTCSCLDGTVVTLAYVGALSDRYGCFSSFGWQGTATLGGCAGSGTKITITIGYNPALGDNGCCWCLFISCEDDENAQDWDTYAPPDYPCIDPYAEDDGYDGSGVDTCVPFRMAMGLWRTSDTVLDNCHCNLGDPATNDWFYFIVTE